jgi:hypothetical protein
LGLIFSLTTVPRAAPRARTGTARWTCAMEARRLTAALALLDIPD